MNFEHTIKTESEEFVNVTRTVKNDVEKSGVKEGVAVIFVPHTTAGITINENADPDVVYDTLKGLRKAFPERGGYRHMEGNSHAHIKASLMGSSCHVIIKDGKLVLGTWQGIYFCEFDGPRTRKMHIKIMSD